MLIKKTIFVLFFFILIGCSGIEAAGKIAQVIADPGIQVGDKDAQPTKLTLSIVAEDILNLNYEGDATPIQIDLFQLKDNSRFLAADYDSIAADPKKILGRSYVDQEEYFIEPSDNQYVKVLELEATTKYIGVVAHYADIDEVIWKKIAKVNPLSEELHFLVLLKDREIRLNRMDEK